MTQKELVKEVADATGITQVNVETTLKVLAQVVRAAVVKGDKVVLPGLGTFTRTFHEARQIKGGFGDYDVPAAFRPRFKALRGFKDAVNGK